MVNSIAIFSEEFLMGGVAILPEYSPKPIITALYIFNIAVTSLPYIHHLASSKNVIRSTTKASRVFICSQKRVLIMMLGTYSFFIADFLRLGGFAHASNYGVNQYDYSIFNILINLFTLCWIIGFVLTAQRLKGSKLFWWFFVNLVFILLTKVIVGYRYFIILLLIAIAFRVLQLARINKLLYIFTGFFIFFIHGIIGLSRSGYELTLSNILFQLGLEFSIVSQINYFVFNDFNEFKFGYSFFSSFLNLVPGLRVLTDNFLFYPALHFNKNMVSAGDDNGFGFSFLSELYMNFGVLGALILSILVTYVNSFVHSKKGSIKNILAPLLIYLMIRIIRSDSIEFVKMSVYAYLIILLLKKRDIRYVWN
ncbi:hypothetical protein [Jiulongibacter sediminis]